MLRLLPYQECGDNGLEWAVRRSEQDETGNKQHKELVKQPGKGAVEQKDSGSLEKVMWPQGVFRRVCDISSSAK